MNDNEIGEQKKSIKWTLTQQYGKNDILEKISHNFVKKLQGSQNIVLRRLYKYVLDLGYEVNVNDHDAEEI